MIGVESALNCDDEEWPVMGVLILVLSCWTIAFLPPLTSCFVALLESFDWNPGFSDTICRSFYFMHVWSRYHERLDVIMLELFNTRTELLLWFFSAQVTYGGV